MTHPHPDPRHLPKTPFPPDPFPVPDGAAEPTTPDDGTDAGDDRG